MVKALLVFALVSISANASIFEGEVSTPTSVHRLLSKDVKLVAEVGLQFLHPDFKEIKNVLVENTQTSTQNRIGNIVPDYPDQLAQVLILQGMLNQEHRWSLSLKTVLPLNSLAQLDTGSIYAPEFVLYRTNLQRPQILIFSGVDATKEIRLGGGVEVGFNATTLAHLFLHAGNGRYSDQRLSIQMKATYTPWLGAEYAGYKFTVRGESKSKLDMNVVAAARIFSNIDAGIPFSYNSESSLYFVPWTFELEKDFVLSESVTLKPSLSYQLWSRFVPAAAIIGDQSQIDCQGQGTCGNSNFSPSRAPEYKTQNLLVPSIGAEWKVSGYTVSGGYRYKASIFQDLPIGFGNYVDPPRHDALVGLRFLFLNDWEMDLHLQVSRLIAQNVVKSNASDIGAPGYEAAGWLYGGGIQVAVPFH